MESEQRKYWVKIHYSKGETVAAVCDEELLGKRIKCDNGLEITVNISFYGGVLVDEDKVFQFVKNATIINLFGERVVGLFIRKGIISERSIVKIGGIPHVQIFY